MMKSIFRSLRVIAPIFMLLLLSAVAYAEVDSTLRQETFERVWTIVNERFYDTNFNGVDWAAVKKTYQKKLYSTVTDDEFYQLLRDMVGELHCTHFAIYAGPPEDDEDASNSGNAEAGVKVRLVENAATIIKVEPNSPAAKAGLKPGYIITSINGKDVMKMWEKIQAEKKWPQYNKGEFAMTVENKLTGFDGRITELTYLDENNVTKTVKMKLKMKEKESVSMGGFDESAEFQSKTLEGNVGYISFDIFSLDLVVKIKNAIRAFHDCPGIIIDLRGNPGGVVVSTMSIASMFYGEMSSLGVMKLRNSEERYTLVPSKDPYEGVVVFLTDETSASSSEVLSCGMQSNGRAVVVGATSMGASLPATMEMLPTGVMLQYVIGDFKTPKGYLIEGHGTVPDYPVELKRADLLAGHDPILEKALEVIKDKQAEAILKNMK